MDDILLNAVLAMDAYNRGYNSGIDLRPRDENGNLIEDAQGNPIESDVIGTQIGGAEIIQNSSVLGPGVDQASNFYAVAYERNGETIISYRGTDDPLGTITESFFGGDIWDGWTAGAGNEDAQQAELAVRFYQDVVEQVLPSPFTDYTDNGVVLTGHSLGGGLAGYIGGIYDNEADIFDNMTFERAANNTYSSTNTELISLVYPTGAYAPDFSKVEATSIEWEVLAYARPFQNTPVNALLLGEDVLLKGTFADLDSYSSTLLWQIAAQAVINEAVARHSISLLVTRLFFSQEDGSDVPGSWAPAAQHFWPVMFDNAFATSVGMDALPGQLSAADNLSSILAYSAIDEGPDNTDARPFGDTGIRALYDDANDLGTALAAGAGSAIETFATNISEAFVNFAGQLALNKVLQSTVAAAVDGILTYTDQSDDQSLTVNLSDNYWGLTIGTPLHNADVSRDALINDALSASGHASVISNLTSQEWGDGTFGAFDRAVFAAKEGGTVFIAENGAYSDKGTLFIGGTGSDTVLGSSSDEVLLAGGGNDIIGASLGTDFGFGDAGNDVFHADSSLDQSLWFDGGADSDLVYLAGKSSSDYTQGTGDVYTSIADPNIVLEFYNVESVVFGDDLNSYAASMASIGSISINRIDPELYVKPLNAPNNNYTRDFSADGSFEASSSMLGEHTGATVNNSLANSYVEWSVYSRSSEEEPSEPSNLIANSLVVDRYTITAPSGSSGWTEFSIVVNEDIGGYFGTNELYGFDLFSGVYALIDVSIANTGYAGTLEYNVLGTWYDRDVDFSDSGYSPVVDGINAGEGFVGSLQTEIQFRFTGPEITFDHYLGAYVQGVGSPDPGEDYSGYGLIGSEIVVPTGANLVAESGYVPGGYDVSGLQQDWLGTTNADDFTGAGFSETVYTYEGADIIAASTGDDTLYGGVDSDTYIFNAGDGQDTINDIQGFDDAIRLGPGIVETDLTLTQAGNDLEITFAGTATDKITVAGHYDTAAYNQIEKIIFDDESELVLSIPDPSPILTNNGGAVDEDGILTVTAAMLDATDMDNTDSELVFTLTAIPSDGDIKKDGVNLAVNDSFTVQDILDSKITFEPATDFNGADGFGFSLSDGTATITGQSFAITVNAINDAPLAQDDAFNGDEDTQITGNVLADNGNGADGDIENDTLSVTAGTFATAQGGSITLQSNGDFTYTPATDFTGTDSFDYTLSDGNDGQDTGSITFDVAPESTAEPPTADQVFVLDPVTVDTVASSTAINNDTFIAKTISVAFQTGSDVTTRQVIYEQGGGLNGIAIFVENGKLYQAMWNYNGGTSWGYKAVEANIAASTEYTSTLVFSASSQSTGTLDAYLDATLTGSETGLGYLYAHSEAVGIGQMKDESRFHNNNEYGDGHTFTGQIDKVAHYNAALQGSTLDQLHDYMGAGSGSPPGNTDPVAQDDAFNGDEDTQITGNVLADNGNGADSDPDNDTLSVTSGTFATTQGGSITLQTNGDFTYTPATDFSGTDSYQYTVSDGNGGQDTGTITFDVAPESATEPPTSDQVFVLDPVTVDTVASSTAVNIDTFVAKTISVAFETGSDITTRQVIYEQGGGDRGIAIFVENGKLYQAVWNYYAGTNWGYKAIETDVMASAEYTSTLVFSASSQSTGTLDAYLNATHVGSETGLGYLYAHSEAVGIGQMKDGSRFHNNNENGDGHTFTGQIDKVAHYNAALQGATLDQLHDYMGDGWLPTYYEINGTSSSDVLNGSQFNDEISGGDGNDTVNASFGDDLLYGGAGNDILYGNDGADTFVFESGTTSGYVDTIQDFDTGEGDQIDISDFLFGYDPLTHAIEDFIQITDDGTDSLLAVDADGGADNFVQIATLLNATGLTDEAALESSGTLIAA